MTLYDPSGWSLGALLYLVVVVAAGEARLRRVSRPPLPSKERMPGVRERTSLSSAPVRALPSTVPVGLRPPVPRSRRIFLWLVKGSTNEKEPSRSPSVVGLKIIVIWQDCPSASVPVQVVV